MQTESTSAMHDRFRVYFGVFHFGVSPARITEIMGIDPSQSWQKGEPGPAGGMRTHDRWELRGGKCEHGSFEEQLDELLAMLEANSDAVAEVLSRYEAGILCTARFREEHNPGCHLSATAIQRLARLGLSCDFDLYVPVEGG